MPKIKISYEDIRTEAKELLRELKKTNSKINLTQVQTLVANKYDCKNLGVLRDKTKKNNGFFEIELTDKIVAQSTDLIKLLFDVEPYHNDGVPYATISLIGNKGIYSKTVRLENKTINNLLDDANTILTLHEHFKNNLEEDYLELVCELLNKRNYYLSNKDSMNLYYNIIQHSKEYRKDSDFLYLDFDKSFDNVFNKNHPEVDFLEELKKRNVELVTIGENHVAQVGYGDKGKTIDESKITSITPSYPDESEEWKTKLPNYLDGKIDKLITEFQKNMREYKPDVAFFTVQAFSIMGGMFFAVNDKITEEEFLEILIDKNNGLPSKEEIKTLSDDELLARVSSISERIFKKAGHESKAQAYDEAHKNMRKDVPSTFRDLEYGNKRKKY